MIVRTLLRAPALTGAARAAPATGSVARTESIHRVLEVHDVPWAAPRAQELPAKTDVLERAVPAAVLVACYTNRTNRGGGRKHDHRH